MNKYKLINQTTKEETICEKIEIDGFDYYVSKDFIEEDNYAINFNTKEIKKYDGIIGLDFSWKKIIATSNPNIDIPKVIDEIEQLALLNSKTVIKNHKEQDLNTEIWISGARQLGFKEGYNQLQQTHPFSESDMIEFGKLCIRQFALFQNRDDNFTQRLLPDWKDQQIKTIYYN